MVDVRGKKCAQPGCPTIASFNWPGLQALYCAYHKQFGMIDVKTMMCSELGCPFRASFFYPVLTSCELPVDPVSNCATRHNSGMVEDSPCALLFELGFETSMTARALIHASGVNEVAAHLLLTDQVGNHVAPLRMDMPQPDAVDAHQPEPPGAPCASLREPTYSRYHDEFLGRESLRLNTPHANKNVLLSIPYVINTFEHVKSLVHHVLLNHPNTLAVNCSVILPVSESARVRVCSSGVGALLLLRLVTTAHFPQYPMNRSVWATAIMRRVSTIHCYRIQTAAARLASAESSNLELDLRAACRAGNLSLAHALFRVSADVEGANAFWRAVLEQDFIGGTNHWRTYAWIRV
jgi:hypothetical protein